MREDIINTFLVKSGFGEATVVPLAGDASFRSYRRLTFRGKSYVLMDAPPDREDVRPFMATSDYLNGLGLSAPQILNHDIENGLLILEDFGDDKFNLVVDQHPEKSTALYRAAIEVLVHLHQATPPETFPLYNKALFFEELFLFCDWYLPALLGEKKPLWRKDLENLFMPLLDRLATQTPRLVLRDYHADNLMWLEDRKDIKRIGLLDFQDAVRGHVAYDLVSLLQDCRRPYSPDLETDMINLYLDQSGWRGTREDFLDHYEILGAQRNMKIIGIFTRLWKRDGKPAYPKMIPHVWTLLDHNLSHPLLADVRNWVNQVAPKESRKL